jgi:acyl carrier protein phosphodiesterase
MNHLAHFLLSGNNDDLKIGNFVADFISNREVANLPSDVQLGVQLHRAIDTFTDTHALVKHSTKILHPFHHKYAPVVLDVHYDFFLSRHWSTFATISLRDYCDQIYTLLQQRHEVLPQKLQKRINAMIADDWLMKCATFEGLQEVFERIGRTAKYDGNFAEAVEHLQTFLPPLENTFLEFFPQLAQYSQIKAAALTTLES